MAHIYSVFNIRSVCVFIQKFGDILGTVNIPRYVNSCFVICHSLYVITLKVAVSSNLSMMLVRTYYTHEPGMEM